MDQLIQIWHDHKGKIVGVALGLVVGLFILKYGFWRTAFVALLVAVGLWLGMMVDREGWAGVMERFARVVQRDR